MNSYVALDASLARFRRRLALWIVARGVAASAAGALLATALGVALTARWELTGADTRPLSTALYAALLAALAGLVGWPLLRLSARRAVRDLESRTPPLDGRAQTYVDRAGPRERENPLLALLAEDAQGVLERWPPGAALPARRIGLGFAAAALGVATLLWLGAAGPERWQFGARQLWSFGIGAPEPALLVEPGDSIVAPGTDVVIRARAEGFEPSALEIRAQLGASERWESAAMEALPDGRFEFRFVGVREPIRYQVAATRRSSAPYRIDLLEVPSIERAKLRYVFPDWAHRSPVEVEPAGPVEAVAGTTIEIEVASQQPLGPAVLVVNGSAHPLEVTAGEGRSSTGRGRFVLEAAGTYYVAAVRGEQRIPLTPEFAMQLTPDGGPEVRLSFPGRDRSASPIEEVSVRAEAHDDFHVESLLLRYSINGGPWLERALRTSGKDVTAEHVFALEELRAVQSATARGRSRKAEAAPAPNAGEATAREDAGEGAPLRPGDVIAYYALARDRQSSARSDLYFIEVRPFERRFLESQQQGGRGSGSGSPEDISGRQRQILISTWNLVRERGGAERAPGAAMRERAALLARLQTTLREQTATLVERARARGLDGSDASVQGYVASLEDAQLDMEEAAGALGELRLEAALPPEQRALQRLLRAEASLRDVSVQQRQNQAGDSGEGGARRDLAELYELEMDPAKNRYETPSRPGNEAGGGAEQDRELREAFERLEELARRQQELAEQLARQQSPTLAQRWQQESLRRELEELRRQLGSRDPQNASQLGQRLQAASEALERASRALERANPSEPDPGNPGRQAAEASRRLRELANSAEDQRREQTRSGVSSLARRAEQLVDRQQRNAEALERAVSGGADGRPPSAPRSGELTPGQQRELAEEKGSLRAELGSLEQDATGLARQLGSRSPELARRLRDAVGELRAAEVREGLSFAQELIEQGNAPYALATEDVVTRGLQEFRDRLQGAERLAPAPGGAAGEERSAAAEVLRAVEALRRRLEAESAPGDPLAAADRPQRARAGAAEPPPLGAALEGVRSSSEARMDALRGEGVPAEALAKLRELQRLLAQSRGAARPLGERSVPIGVALEEVELALRRHLSEAADADRIHPSSGSAPAGAVRPTVAEYYRELGGANPAPPAGN